jgi:endonuclease/exonuclease/phosphatase family metal-dependent hydrolase
MIMWLTFLWIVVLALTGCRESPLEPRVLEDISSPHALGAATHAPTALQAFPGRVQAEDYNATGPGSGYRDLTVGNDGRAYRADDVDIEATTDEGGGYNVGWIDAGEWLAYDVSVAQTGLYTLTLRMASAVAGVKTAAVVVDGIVVGEFHLQDAKGWQGWQDVTVQDVSLTQGRRALRIEMRTGGFNVNYLDAVKQIAPPELATLEIMSFNVQQPYGTSWESRRDKAVAMLSAENPDIVGSQEAVADQRDYLLSRLPQYGCYGVGRDGGESGEASWIFYRKDRFTVDSAESGNFWLSATPDQPSRYGGSYNRLCTHARLVEKKTGKALHLFNAHFYMGNEPQWRSASARKLAAEMAKRKRSGEPVLATGDFNSTESDAVTRWMKSGTDNPFPLRDSYRDFDPFGRVTTGFGVKLDYVYLEKTSPLRVLKAWVVTAPVGVSDHIPISATLAW